MAQEEQKLNIYQKMQLIRKKVEVLRKNKSGFNYKYVTDDEINARITGDMEKLGVSLIPSIVPGTAQVIPHSYEKTKITKSGEVIKEMINEIIVLYEMIFKWVDDADPEQKIEIPWFAIGQQGDASQAFGSGLSYSSRYFKLCYFNISTTEDDPDNWRSKQREIEEQEKAKVAAGIIDQVADIVAEYTNVDDEKIKEARRKDIQKIVMKRAVDKNGKPSFNYNNIKDPSVAAALLEDVKAFTTKADKKEN